MTVAMGASLFNKHMYVWLLCILCVELFIIHVPLNPGVGNRPVITYAHLSQVDRVV